MQGKFLVAVCDILGFTPLVREHPIEDVVHSALAFFRKALKHSVMGGEFAHEPPATSDLDGHKNIGVVWFSDTVLLYTRQDTDEAVGELLQAVASLLFETIVQGTTKIRAGVAYGEAYMDEVNSIFVGTPISDAHGLEKVQQWAGAALTSSACERVRACGVASGEIARFWLTEWGVPIRGGRADRTYVVNWNECIHAHDWRLRWSSSLAEPPEDDTSDIAMKFRNTRKFHLAHCKDCADERLQP